MLIPKRYFAGSLFLSLFLETFLFGAMTVIKIICFFQPPKTWNLAKLLDEFVGLGGKLLGGNMHKFIFSECSYIMDLLISKMLCRIIQGHPRGKPTIST
jgi:hypothetical protein